MKKLSGNKVIKITAFVVVIVVLVWTTFCTLSIDQIYYDDASIARFADSGIKRLAHQTSDGQQGNGSFATFIGKSTLWTYNVPEDMELEISCLLSVEKGLAKLVLINPDKTVITILESTPDTSSAEIITKTLLLKKGRNKIKLVATDKAEIIYELYIDEGNFKH
ncbi:hypothetical protein AN642_01505 [Epulopiscium sp. SCG-B10WGA-EpuloA2]|nr:hypothetical protein AN642_01505 [Epulopiscium sp. SCG-B10WGA-EpuloA2]